MDFDTHYTEEQEDFRTQVKAWLEENAPKGLDIPPDGRPLKPETQRQVRAFQRMLGTKGWLAPSWPQEIGGGELSHDFEVIIQEELNRLDLPAMGDSRRWIPAMMVWGTREQQLRYVVPALRGETITWQAFSEPDAGSHLASVKTQAVQDGNEYVVSGVKGFITGRFDPDYLWTLVVTDPARPPRFNLGILMIEARLPGVTMKTQRLLMGSERRVHLDNVRVPDDCLVGTPYMGWEIVQTMLEQERGGFAFRVSDQGTIDSVMRYLREERSRS